MRALLEDPRYEIVPVKGVEEEIVHLPPRAHVSVTCSPKKGIEPTLALTESLCVRGFRAVPHVSARLVESEDRARDLARRLTDAGANDVFVVGGDVARPVGPFDSSLALVRALRRSGYEGSIGVACYPEPHPFIPTATLWQVLSAKQEHASYMVSQICFDATMIVDWVAAARSRGISLPLWVGFPGVVERNKLMRVALRIGVGDSTRFLTKHGSLVSRLVRPGGYNPDELVRGLEPHVGKDELRIAGYHINTFNQVASTERWRRAALAAAAGPRSSAAPG